MNERKKSVKPRSLGVLAYASVSTHSCNGSSLATEKQTVGRGGSRGRVQGVRTLSPLPEMKSSSYSLLKFVYLTCQWRHSIEVQPS